MRQLRGMRRRATGKIDAPTQEQITASGHTQQSTICICKILRVLLRISNGAENNSYRNNDFDCRRCKLVDARTMFKASFTDNKFHIELPQEYLTYCRDFLSMEFKKEGSILHRIRWTRRPDNKCTYVNLAAILLIGLCEARVFYAGEKIYKIKDIYPRIGN